MDNITRSLDGAPDVRKTTAALIERTFQLLNETRELREALHEAWQYRLNLLATVSERIARSRALLAKEVHGPLRNSRKPS